MPFQPNIGLPTNLNVLPTVVEKPSGCAFNHPKLAELRIRQRKPDLLGRIRIVSHNTYTGHESLFDGPRERWSLHRRAMKGVKKKKYVWGNEKTA